MTIESAKKIIEGLWQDLLKPNSHHGMRDMSPYAEDIEFYGPAPIGRLTGRVSLFEEVYTPLIKTFPNVQRKPYLFLGGEFEGGTWVVSAGEYIGVMQQPYLGIPTTDNEVKLRFGEFYKIEGDTIVEIRCLFDILGLAAQAGYPLIPPFDGRSETPPGPALDNGLCLTSQDPDESRLTLDIVEGMLGGCNRLKGSDLKSMGMSDFWHEDMVWHGPWGVGSCYGFQEFQDFAQGPSVASFPGRTGGYHRARIAEGKTAAFTGWPSLKGNFSGKPFRGFEPTGKDIGMNIMDFYVRRDDKLHENWVLIDLIEFGQQCGINLLDKLPTQEAETA
ncbi:ester cyclase [Vibrio paucivorans]